MHYALRTQRSWGSVSRDSWKIGERSRSERSRYEREQTTRYGTIWLETAEQPTFLRASCYTFSERRCLDLLPGLWSAVVLSSVLRFHVNAHEEKAGKRKKKGNGREGEKHGETRGCVEKRRKTEGEAMVKLERRNRKFIRIQKVCNAFESGTWLFCIRSR